MTQAILTKRSELLNPRHRGESGIATLVILFLLGSVALVLLLLHLGGYLNGLEMFKLNPKEEEKAASLVIGPVRLGQTVESVTKEHPEMTITATSWGGYLGRFVDAGATFSVAFLGPDGGHKAFRIRYDQAFQPLSSDEVLARYAGRFGRPTTTECQRSIIWQGGRCQFKWMMAKGLQVNVFSRTMTDSDSAKRTEITLGAIDTRLQARLRRSGDVGAVTTTSIRRDGENIPLLPTR